MLKYTLLSLDQISIDRSVIINKRIYLSDDDQWYWRLRGGDTVGPFDSQEAAELSLAEKMRSWHNPKGRPIKQAKTRLAFLLRRSATD
ncbi:MAG: hypothetical protein L7T19_07180 [Pseudomonadales bacterium]|nr:hypothetical protein [Pseudomonadales bacterium]